jgi:hypothetical protein
VVREFASLLQTYHVSRVQGDRYAGEWPRERFREHGVTYVPSEKPKSDLYRDLLPAINSRRLDLLDDARLLSQLVGLERRTARGGKDSIDHAPGSHDDIANAVAGVAVLASKPGYDASLAWIDGDDDVAPADASAVAADAERLGRFRSEWQRRNFMTYCATGGYAKPPWSY